MSMFYGLINLPWWGYIVLTLVLTHVTSICITIYLHRCQAHRAITVHPIAAHFFRFWLWATTGMETKAWTAIHRKHHSRCETIDDPHSPQVLGLKTVFWQGAELYRKESKNQETMDRYGQGTPDDWMERNVYSHSGKGLLFMFLVNVILFGVPGIAVWAGQMIWTPLAAAGLINGIGHYWGYRNFECTDAATNISPWGIFVVGEELHNNHHTFGTSAKFSVKPWEFDLGWGYVCFLKMFGLVSVKRVPPQLQEVPGRQVDLETVKAVVANRFQVMSHYSQEVVYPVFQELKQKGSEGKERLTRHVRRLLILEDSLMDKNKQAELANVLKHNETLRTVYHYRQQLQAIWGKTTATHKELLDALQEWCHQAEATGIAVLQQFVKRLRTFTSVSALRGAQS